MAASPEDMGAAGPGSPEFSVVVPVYNSTTSLVELARGLEQVFQRLGRSYELILVDDASPNPETWSTMRALPRQFPQVRVIQLLHNVGQHNATLCGLRQARGMLVLTMDDDLQHPPREIPKLLEAYGDGERWDAILAVDGSGQRSRSAYRSAGSWLFNRLMNSTIRKPQGLRFSSFRLMNRALCTALLDYRGHIVTINSLICMQTHRVVNVQVDLEKRRYGRSGYSFKKLAALALNHLFNFSARPLELISALGTLVAFLAILYALLVFYWRFTGAISQAGFATIAILVSFFAGVLLFSLGIIGQYVVRILRTITLGQQSYIRDMIGAEEVSASFLEEHPGNSQ